MNARIVVPRFLGARYVRQRYRCCQASPGASRLAFAPGRAYTRDLSRGYLSRRLSYTGSGA